ncbi:hypothetical protein DDB_G0281537 [Dictyostelium discoideum AX4]|uniref:Uncharacterized protein n=1 Tax=Dictyostelium discoideum TaxID=44689 RepID=Q54TV4_DICDI|nr:hypothetical protein DDB_G0281537 [Dictyostelium discoideum AX4]EAL66750.1 hypothetical protein DDB_G0281537 [Dictyostelium discoideum AX4]|eukprot:XP_640707.1 hypothetical protein DDB_G0281537 [Dictyostelium discoideum AX4]
MAQVAAKGGIDFINSSFQAINTGYDMGVKIRNDIIKNRIISHVFSFFSIVSVKKISKILDKMEEKKKYKKTGLIEKYRNLINENNEFKYALLLEVGYKVGTSGKDTRAYRYVMGFVQMSKDLSTYLNDNGIIENLKTYTTILKDRVGDTYVKTFFPSITNGWSRKKAVETKSYIEEIVISQIYLLLKGLNPYDSSIFKSIYETNSKRREQNSELQKDVVIFQYIELDSNGVRFQKILDILVNNLDLAQNRSDNSFNLQTMMNSIFENSISLNDDQDKRNIKNLSPILPKIFTNSNSIPSSPSQLNGASSSSSPSQQQFIETKSSLLLPPIVKMPSSPPISPLLKNSSLLNSSKDDKESGGGGANPIRNAASTLDLIKKLKQSNYQPNITIIKPFKISKLKKKTFMQDEDIDEIEEKKNSNLNDNHNHGGELPIPKPQLKINSLVKSFFLKYSLLAKSIDEFENKGIPNNFLIIFINELIERFESQIDFKLLFNPSVTRYMDNDLNLNFDFQMDDIDPLSKQNLNLNHIIDKNVLGEIVNPIINCLEIFKNKDKIINFDKNISNIISNILISKFKHQKEINDKLQQHQSIPLDETSKLLVQYSIINFINPVIKEFSNYIKYIHLNVVFD